jgi:hypothetical protein
MKALREILHNFFSGPLVCMKLLDPHAAPCSLQLHCTPHCPLEERDTASGQRALSR